MLSGLIADRHGELADPRGRIQDPGRTHREVPVVMRARTAIKLWAQQFPDRQPGHFVFPSEHVGAAGDNFDARIKNTKPIMQVGSLKTAWTSANKAAKVSVRWHDLRHTCVTRLLESGQTLPMIASIMGWSASTTVRMAQRYGHISTEARRAAMESMNAPRTKPSNPELDSNHANASKIDAIH